ncbi:hypothetical protein [Fictibacillus phosphorivorans]|uniref:Uncharacterized protein n=1 Tax=Fictibacillus phosphorivorans TaxID=1221500 RepID=A0A160IID3_9BACL|nr:hypothetical protein [Fictibacillus phosphorivorans]ANC75738.1 hypothetical protein ABE65_002340 [Fictibacillus phosphorivorans]MQR96100.1 hypothetical protein [Fictibacillus phosphorivorans]
MILLNNTFKKARHTKYDYFYHIAFAVLFCLYSFLMLFSSKLLGFLFFVYGLLLLGHTVWKGIRTRYSIPYILFGLTILFFSRLFWLEAFSVLPVLFYEIFQISFFLGIVIGICLLYGLMVKGAPLANKFQTHGVHSIYFVTGCLLLPYTWIFSYGAVMQGNTSSLIWALLILVLWGLLYFAQLVTHHNKVMLAALFAVNIGVGCWAIYRWINILT